MQLNHIWLWITKNKDWLFSGFALVLIGWIVKAVLAVLKRLRNKITDIQSLVQTTKLSRDKQYFRSGIVDRIGIDKIVRKYYREYREFLVIQYGSSVRDDCSEPNDYDFIVLLLGYPKGEDPDIYNIGHAPELGFVDANQQEVDVVFRDYNSFLFALVSGMPYENSVVSNGKIIHGPQGYFLWLKRIARNILIDREFLLRRYREDKLPVERDKWRVSIREHSDMYTFVRATYFYVCSLIQRNLISEMDDVILHKNVAKVAVADYLHRQLKDSNDYETFGRVISYLKRKESPAKKQELIRSVEALVKNLNDFEEGA